MRHTTALSFCLCAALALTACGGRVKLQPQQGENLPVKPESSLAQPTVDQMITPGPQAKPKRSDDLLTRSEERRDDKFDLPPKG
ncbi:MAG: hypothetical protein RLZ59_428 [Pseudomonadota bacterium]|jgi:hypothetical protein